MSVRETRLHYFVLTICTPLNTAGLNEIDDVLLNFVYRPSESSAHTLELDGGKWLEVEKSYTVSNRTRQFVDMREEVDIRMSCLLHR
jgi:hypothetical protein